MLADLKYQCGDDIPYIVISMFYVFVSTLIVEVSNLFIIRMVFKASHPCEYPSVL